MLELTGSNPGVIVVADGEITLALSAMGPTLQQVFIGSGLTTGELWDDVAAAADNGAKLTDSLVEAGVNEDRARAVSVRPNGRCGVRADAAEPRFVRVPSG